MEPKFQTSFIPKKPMAGFGQGGGIAPMAQRQPRHITSLYMFLAVMFFVVSLVGVAGAYGYEQYLKSSQDGLKRELADREKQFNIDRIELLKQVNVQIDTAGELLRSHLAVSSVFQIISQLTIDSVRFLSLSVSAPAIPGDGVKIGLDGVGTSLSTVAFQSDVLGTLERYGLRKIVKNPILSDPSIEQNGTVTFGFEATIDPDSISYEKTVTGTGEASDASAEQTAP